MLDSKTIMIVDSSGYAALDLSEAIEEAEGRVAGPVATLSEARAILESADIDGAVIDCDLDEASDLVLLLAGRRVPLVIATSGRLPPALETVDGRASVLVRPVDPRTVIECLLVEIGRSELDGDLSNSTSKEA